MGDFAVSQNGHEALRTRVKQLPWSGTLTAQELSEHLDMAALRTVRRGEIVVAERAPAEDVFVLMDGALIVEKAQPSGETQAVGFLFKGDAFGVVHGGRYTYTVRSLDQGEVLVLPRDGFERICERSPRLQRAVLQMASNELMAAQDHLVLLGRKSASERLATLLLQLEQRQARREQVNAHPRQSIWLPMRRSDIANHLGLTLETVSRLFSAFTRKGLIRHATRHSVEIADHKALLQLASGDMSAN